MLAGEKLSHASLHMSSAHIAVIDVASRSGRLALTLHLSPSLMAQLQAKALGLTTILIQSPTMLEEASYALPRYVCSLLMLCSSTAYCVPANDAAGLT